MNRIVRENYPVADLPEDLRPDGEVMLARVTVEVSGRESERGISRPTLEDLWRLRRPPFRSVEEIVEQIRRDRDEWDE